MISPVPSASLEQHRHCFHIMCFYSLYCCKTTSEVALFVPGLSALEGARAQWPGTGEEGLLSLAGPESSLLLRESCITCARKHSQFNSSE